MKKFDLKGPLLGILMAVGAGLAAFGNEIENQKKDRKIEKMESRLDLLEANFKNIDKDKESK